MSMTIKPSFDNEAAISALRFKLSGLWERAIQEFDPLRMDLLAARIYTEEILAAGKETDRRFLRLHD